MRLRNLILGTTTLVLCVGSVTAGVAFASGTGSASHQKTAANHHAVDVPARADTVFVPVTPCRIVDTRSAGGYIGSSGRSFYVAGTANFPKQGGKSGGCGIPAAATSVAVNLTATNEAKGGFLTAFPAGGTKPTASVLNYQKGVVLANALTLKIRPGTNTGLAITSSATTQVVADVTGFYEPQIEAYVDNGGKLTTGTSRVTSATQLDTGSYSVTVDTDIFNCATNATAPSGAITATAVPTSDDALIVRTYDAAGNPADSAFNLVVTC